MAITNLFRGGMPDFKGWFCDGQFAEFTPPFDAPHAKFTPPFDSHADAAHGQGYLNLHFPLVPNLNDTVGHRWMQYGLKGLKAEGDVILTNWVPLRSYVDSVYYEANLFDSNLAGVYAKPVAYRVAWDFANEEWTYTEITASVPGSVSGEFGLDVHDRETMREELVKQAGKQYAQTGRINEALLAEIGSPMIPEEQYAAIVNGGMGK